MLVSQKAVNRQSFFRPVLTLFFLATAMVLATATISRAAPGDDPDADFDRLDGFGPSGKKVQVIEWEGNLEVHVYPKGSLAGLAAKLDKNLKDRKVLVLAYRFSDNPKAALIRRAILGIDLKEGFKAFKDKMENDYDKIVISNNGLSGDLAAFKLDPEPKQLYPDGHPALNTPAKEDYSARKNPVKSPTSRFPANSGAPAASGSDDEPAQAPSENKQDYDDDGRIRPFMMEPRFNH